MPSRATSSAPSAQVRWTMDGLATRRQAPVSRSSSPNSHSRCSAPSIVRAGSDASGSQTGWSRRLRMSQIRISARPPSSTLRKTRLRSRGVRRAGRKPLPARAHGGLSALGPRAVQSRVVGVGAPGPRPVGELVVVERRDHRQRQVKGLDVRVAAVLRVAGPVLGERPALPVGLERAADVGAGRLPRGGLVGGLVDVVAEVQEEVEVAALGDPRVGVEVAGVELRARAGREAHPLRAGAGQGPGAPGCGALALQPRSRSGSRWRARGRRRRRGPCGRARTSATASPCATTSRSPGSRARRQVTGSDASSVVARVHRTTDAAVGSPLATPWRNIPVTAGEA